MMKKILVFTLSIITLVSCGTYNKDYFKVLEEKLIDTRIELATEYQGFAMAVEENLSTPSKLRALENIDRLQKEVDNIYNEIVKSGYPKRKLDNSPIEKMSKNGLEQAYTTFKNAIGKEIEK